MGGAQHVGPTHKCVTGLKIYIFSADKTKIHFFMFLHRQSQFILCGEKKGDFSMEFLQEIIDFYLYLKFIT